MNAWTVSIRNETVLFFSSSFDALGGWNTKISLLPPRGFKKIKFSLSLRLR